MPATLKIRRSPCVGKGEIRMGNAVFEFSSAEKQILEELPSAVGVYQYTDGQIVPVLLSERFRELFGYDSEEQAKEAVGSDLYRDAHPDDAVRVSESRYQFAAGAPAYDIVYRNRTRYQSDYHIIHETGRHVWKDGIRLDYITFTDESRVLNRDEDRKMQLSASFLQEISLEDDLHRNQFDHLTGLPMIGRLFQDAPERIREMKEHGKTPAILWFDFSRMRDYYALHGFATGDTLIRGLAWLIRDQFGFRNTSRVNNDSFVVCAETGHLEEDIRHMFDEAVKLNQENSHPIAAGICVMDQEDISLAAAIDRAKLACDSLHEPMHSSYAFFTQEMLDRAELTQYIFQNYQKAMDKGWIQVYYQPVIRTVTGKLCGAEALCRWNDPVHGMISPGMFIPALEEEGRIGELDLYMLEQVCRDGRDLMRAGMPIVPVSVNLSRKDFRNPKLVETIEATAREYGIPRELLNMEITESAFVRHAERLSKYISLFHQLGYQVWMDDFGTAYSSLGSLKDLNFDELKIDMSFLSSSTDKARTIITSVVRMAKEIGIQTLAEGVETEEQYEFLRKIGCEKIQGFYFGKPMDRTAFLRHCREKRIGFEPLRMKKYYDALGRIDFQTDEPLCVIEDDGVTLQKLFVNDEYREVMRRDNIDDIDAWMEEINEDNNPAHALHRQYANEQLRKLPGPQVVTYPSGDHYMELTGNVVAHYEEHYIYAVNVRYIQLNTMTEDQKKALYIQYMYYLCNDIAIFDLKNDSMYGLKSIDSSQPVGAGGKTVNLHQAAEIYAEKFVYAPDQERYHAFFDLETLRDRMQQKKGQDLTAFFRSRTAGTDYRWMLHMIMPIPKSDFNRYLIITLPVEFDMGFRRILQCGDDSESDHCRIVPPDSEEITPALLWKNLQAYAGGMYFWKDADRRFLGASHSFLEYYGFSSLKEILGKTDEDMHWHVEPEAFRKDELNVLRYGKNIAFAKGKCIVRGKQRTIMANKIPIYRDGKIIGLMGNFFDAEDLTCLLDDSFQSASVDAVTDLLNARGISESLKDYLEALWTENTEFAMIRVHVPEYTAFQRIYGEEAGNALLYHIGDVLKGVFGRESSIGRPTGSYFTILIQDTDPDHLQKSRTKIQEDISMLRTVGEWHCALTAEVEASLMNQTNASRKIYAKNLDAMLTGFSTS